MATLSSTLSGGSTPTRATRGTSYAYPKPYVPYSVPRRGVGPIESAGVPYQGQDLASALLQQKLVSRAATPDSRYTQDLSFDPILSRIQALSGQSLAAATTNAAQLRKEALIRSGATGIGQELKFDQSTLDAAAQNPESQMRELQRMFEQKSKELEEAMSAQNLLYSGEYVHNLSDLAQGRASQEASIGSGLRSVLSDVDTGLLTASEAARQQALAAQTDLITQANFAGHPIFDPKTGTYVYPTGETSTGGTNPNSGSSGRGPYSGENIVGHKTGTDGNEWYTFPDGSWWTTDAQGNWVEGNPTFAGTGSTGGSTGGTTGPTAPTPGLTPIRPNYEDPILSYGYGGSGRF